MNMTKDEVQLEYAKWWLLQEIKKGIDKDGSPTEVILRFNKKVEPPDKWQRRALEELLRSKVITAEDVNGVGRPMWVGVDIYKIWTSKSFDKTYATYKSKNLKSKLNKIKQQSLKNAKRLRITAANIDKHSKGLSRRFDEIVTATSDGHFFSAIDRYVRYLDDNGDLSALIFSDVKAQSDADHEKFEQLHSAVEKEIDRTLKIIKKKTSSEDELPDDVTKEIKRLNDAMSGRLSGAKHQTMNTYDQLCGLVQKLGATLPEKFGNMLVKDSLGNPYRRYSDDYKAFVAETERLTTTASRTSLWGAWNNLVEAAALVRNNPEHERDIIARQDFLEAHGWFTLKNIMTKLINGEPVDESERLGFLLRNDYEPYARKIHNHALELLESSDETPILHSKNIKLEPSSYDAASTVLIIGGERLVISMQKNRHGNKLAETNEARLMRQLFKNVNTMRNGVPIRTIASVSGINLTPKKIKQVKNYASAINKKVKEVTGIEHLISWDNSKLWINGVYLN